MLIHGKYPGYWTMSGIYGTKFNQIKFQKTYRLLSGCGVKEILPKKDGAHSDKTGLNGAAEHDSAWYTGF